MKLFRCIGICACLTLTCCIGNNALGDGVLAEANISNLTRISLGMKETQVLKIMRTPFKQESFRVGCDSYHVWFYVTNYTALGQKRMVTMNLTPLTFRNCRLVGTGYSYYRWLRDQKKIVVKTSFSEQKQLEDKKIEKALEESLTPNQNDALQNPHEKSPTMPKVPPSNQPLKNQGVSSKKSPLDTKPTQQPSSPPPSNKKPQSSKNQKKGDGFQHEFPGVPTSFNDEVEIHKIEIREPSTISSSKNIPGGPNRPGQSTTPPVNSPNPSQNRPSESNTPTPNKPNQNQKRPSQKNTPAQDNSSETPANDPLPGKTTPPLKDLPNQNRPSGTPPTPKNPSGENPNGQHIPSSKPPTPSQNQPGQKQKPSNNWPSESIPIEASGESSLNFTISMSSPPKSPNPPENLSEEPSDKPQWNEEDQQKIQEESQQNFDFW